MFKTPEPFFYDPERKTPIPMKKILSYLFPAVAAVTAVAPAAAQPMPSAAQPADARRLLTMEEAVLGKGLAVADFPCRWRDEGAVCTFAEDGALYAVDARTGRRTTLATLAELGALLGDTLTRMPAYTWQEGLLVCYAGRDRVGVDLAAKRVVYRRPMPRDAASLLPMEDGRWLYTRANNLYWCDAEGAEHAITEERDPGIVCGQAVSRNEFGIDRGIFPAPDGRRTAFYRKDERRVTTFPLLDVTTRTGSLVEIRYPMAGMTSERVSIEVYDFDRGTTVRLDVTDFDEERYLTNVAWGPASDRLYVQVLDREQKRMHLNEYDAADGRFLRTILTEESPKYVEPLHPIRFLDGEPDRFVYTASNRDGYRGLYLGSLAAGTLERLTKVDADVELVALRGRWIFYASAEVSPVERHLFRLDRRTGRTVRLTPDEGWHACRVSPDGRYVLDSYSSLRVPRVVRLASADGRTARELFRAEDPSAALNYGSIELGTVRSADGRYDNYYRLIKPHDFDPAKKYPVILYVYGGPHSQMVQNTFQAQLRRWEMYMAQHGYVVFVMDNRGTMNRGLAYEQATHRRLGRCEMEDQIAGLEWLLAHPWADRDRVGVHGWSFGGFMTISLMTNYPDLFKVGVAGGPVIDWKWYEVMYGERYMETPERNPEGYAATSLLPMAAKLRGKLLICQGAVDRTVVWQHSLNFVRACIDAGVQVDYFPYPTHEHNVLGKDRVHLMQKVTDYFEDYL